MFQQRILAHKDKPHRKRVRAAAGFDCPTSLVGTSAWLGADGKPVAVYYDPATGADGAKAAQNVLAGIDALMAWLDDTFAVRGLGANAIVAALDGNADGTGGAYHYGCLFGSQGGDWYADVSHDARETFGLVAAEACESYMGLQNRGWNCGESGGESLSRLLAEIVSGGPNGSLLPFASGDSWDGTDWISRDQGTDGDYPSIGCGVLYLWWMLRKYTVAQIVQAGEPAGTLASNYAALTGTPAAQAFADFKAAVAAAGGPTSDNPFGTPSPAWPPMGPAPQPQPQPAPTAPTEDAVRAAVEAALAAELRDRANPWRYFGLVSAVRAEEVADAAIRTLYAPAQGANTIRIPPWLLPFLERLCAAGAPLAPPPWDLILAALCPHLPAARAAAAKPCGCK